jgi:hypothetical protein
MPKNLHDIWKRIDKLPEYALLWLAYGEIKRKEYSLLIEIDMQGDITAKITYLYLNLFLIEIEGHIKEVEISRKITTSIDMAEAIVEIYEEHIKNLYNDLIKNIII